MYSKKLAPFAWPKKKVQKSIFTEVKIQKSTDFFMHKESLCAFTQKDLFQIKWKHEKEQTSEAPRGS